jgi:hypothetical protein
LIASSSQVSDKLALISFSTEEKSASYHFSNHAKSCSAKGYFVFKILA